MRLILNIIFDYKRQLDNTVIVQSFKEYIATMDSIAYDKNVIRRPICDDSYINNKYTNCNSLVVCKFKFMKFIGYDQETFSVLKTLYLIDPHYICIYNYAGTIVFWDKTCRLSLDHKSFTLVHHTYYVKSKKAVYKLFLYLIENGYNHQYLGYQMTSTFNCKRLLDQLKLLKYNKANLTIVNTFFDITNCI